MLNVIETFTGIGSQKQALKNIEVDYNIVCTIEWEIGAIISYYLMYHKGKISHAVKSMTKEQLVEELSGFNLSNDGKTIISKTSLIRMPLNKLRMLYQALHLKEKPHYTDITKVRGVDLPDNANLLTYSFPCQDLSLGSVFHNGNNNGIKKNGGTRSGLLWEVERILDERLEKNLSLPDFLLMENVMQVFSKKHQKYLSQWLEKLEELGYYNHYASEDQNKKWILNAVNFGIPQIRKRAFLLSVRTHNNKELNSKIENYLLYENNLTRPQIRELKSIESFIFVNKYFSEQEKVHPNYTRSRKKIHGKITEKTKSYNSKGNPILVKYDHLSDTQYFTKELARTITTKQDRDPNAGLIETKWGYKNGKPYRYLTHRECFLLMGFPNHKYEKIKNSNIKGLEGEKLYKLAGNSICVPVLEEIFLAVNHIKEEFLNDK